MIVRWPGQIKPAQVNTQVWAFWDFLPTATDIAMVKPPVGIDGISMLPSLLGQTQTNQHACLYWEFHERGFQQAVRMGRWKAVRPQADQPLELYDLETDLGETKNVAQAHPDIVAQAEANLKFARAESPDWPIKKPSEKNATDATKPKAGEAKSS
jgi:arylsulfatase A-like enzyme